MVKDGITRAESRGFVFFGQGFPLEKSHQQSVATCGSRNYLPDGTWLSILDAIDQNGIPSTKRNISDFERLWYLLQIVDIYGIAAANQAFYRIKY